MKNYLSAGVGAVALTVAAAVAAEPLVAQDAPSLTGRWELTREAPSGGGGGGRGGRGGGPTVLELVQDGATLTGTVETRRGTSQIQNGKVEGNTVTFTVIRETPRGTFESTYRGVLENGVLSGTTEAGGGRFTINWRATRVET